MRAGPQRFVINPAQPRIFYRVVDRENPEKNLTQFFLKDSDAILYEILTNPDLLPVHVRELNLARFNATIPSPDGNLFRFPESSRYRLVSFTPVQSFDAYPTEREDVEIAQDMEAGLTVGCPKKFVLKTNILRGNYAAGIDTTLLDWNALFQEVLNLATSDVRKWWTYAIDGRIVTNPDGVIIPITVSFISWNNIWEAIILKIRGTKDLGEIRTYLDFVIHDPAYAGSLIGSPQLPGYDDCLYGIRGYHNPHTSCFMDSTLLAMFAFRNSPFTDNLIDTPLRPNTGFPRCNADPARDEYLRTLVDKHLREDYANLASGAVNVMCSKLRMVLGKGCNLSGLPQDDFSQQMADPQELYVRLLQVLGYDPIEFTETVMRASSADGANASAGNRQIQSGTMLPGLRADNPDLQRVSWPDSWNTAYENVNSGDNMTYRRSEYAITRADCIVVHVDRSIYGQLDAGQAKFEVPTQLPVATWSMPFIPLPTVTEGSVPATPLVSGFSFEDLIKPPAEFPPVGSGGTSSYFNALPTIFPTVAPSPQAPHEVPIGLETRVNPRRLVVERTFVVNGVPYDLRAVVYSVHDGHWAALLNCGSNWFGYNDMDVSNLIMENLVGTEEAIALIETRGALLFYYPPLEPLSKLQRDVVRAASQRNQ